MIKTLYPTFRDKWSATGSIYIISDTHFDDADCKLMNPNWIPAQEATDILKSQIHKTDTLIHLGDVGNPAYLDQLKCYKILITGNHDKISEMEGHFDEIYNGPLFIADRILLSHEPILGLERICLNLHGHVHNGGMLSLTEIEPGKFITSHINLASDVTQFQPYNLKSLIKAGYLSNVENYHRITIDKATENSLRENRNEENNI